MRLLRYSAIMLVLGLIAQAPASALTLDEVRMTDKEPPSIDKITARGHWDPARFTPSPPIFIHFDTVHVELPPGSLREEDEQLIFEAPEGSTGLVRASFRRDTAAFSLPTGALVGWASSDVSWVSTGTAWTPNNSALSAIAGTYVQVASCTANATSCSSTDLTFTLASKSGIDGSGAFALVVTWKFESI